MPTIAYASASLTLAEIRSILFSEISAQPAALTITLRRDIVTIVAVALGEVIDDVSVLEEGASAADRLTRELTILRAEVERLRLEATARQVLAQYRRSALAEGGNVVDLGGVLAREHRPSPPPPTGGAA